MCVLAVSWCLCCFSAGLPDPALFEGKTITAIGYEPASQPLTADALAAAMPLKPNTPFHAADLRAAIQQLYATGEYEDIAAEGEAVPGGVAIVFRTKPQWFIGRVESDGKFKTPPNRGQVTAAANLQLGADFEDSDVEQARQSILRLLRNNGFYGATVKPEISRDASHQQVNIRYLVTPGKRARLAEPTITGDAGMPTAEVAKATKWKGWFRWKADTQANVQKGLQNVSKHYDKQDRLMSQVSLQGRTYHPETNTVSPTVDVTAGPRVRIETTGAKVSKGKLKTYVPVYDENAVDRGLLTEGAGNLRDYFQLQGDFDARVDYDFKQVSPDRQNIVYTIRLGARRKLAAVSIEGNHYFSTHAITERMFIQPAGLIRLRHGRFSSAFAKRNQDSITALYQSNGFRDVKVKISAQSNFQGKANEMQAAVDISEGSQYTVSSLTITGVHQMDLKRLRGSLSSITGEPFSEYNVATDRESILRAYNSQGFSNAAFDWSRKPGPQPNQVAVEYNITEGQRRLVRDVVIAGAQNTSPRLIDPAIDIHKGEPLSLSAMTETQRNLYNLGVFDRVDMAVQNPSGDTTEKYVLYQLEQGPRYQLATGFGAEIAQIGGSETSYLNPAGTTGFTPRGDIDVSRQNLWGLAHTLDFKGSLSTLEQLASLNYYWPRFHNAEGHNLTATILFDDSENVRTFTSQRTQGSLQMSQKLSRASTMLYRFTYRRSTISNLKIEPLLVPLFQAPALVGIFEVNYIQDRRDDPVNAHRGIYNTVDVGFSDKVFGSSVTFGRFLATNATYHPLGSSLVLARRIQFGFLQPFSVGPGFTTATDIPFPERFFSGGTTSIRAFPDNQAGPRDPDTGFPLGGNVVLANNTELRFPLVGTDISGVLFHDMGNVYSSLSSISFHFTQRNLTDFNYLVHAIGFGIRYQTPVGPIRVDLAYSINPPSFYGLNGTPEQVIFGTAPRVLQNISHFQFFFSIGQMF